jgi:hypothetical protein
MKDILSIKITLNRTDPPIWRRILVPSSVTFFDLHHILQIGMGWKNSHLFEFLVGDYKLGYINPHEAFEDMADANEVTLDLLLLKEGLAFTYLYDFGDGWEHTVTVENLLEKDKEKNYPICIDGQLNCPPEDSGGTYGFYQTLEILKDKKHSEYEFMKNWVGGGYNPEKFDVEKVNKELPKFKSYMKRWK